MDQTKKYLSLVSSKKFCSEPMDDKSICDVPGIGIHVAAKLMRLNYTRARDLYDLLKKLQYNEKKFKDFLFERVQCNTYHVSVMYRAFIEWRNNFDCPQETKGHVKSPSPEDPNARPSTCLGGRKRVRFNLPPESPEPKRAHQRRPSPPPTANAQDLLVNFYTSLAGEVRTIPQELHREFRLDILNIIHEYALERRRQAEEST